METGLDFFSFGISDDTFLKAAVFCEHHAMTRYLVISIFGTERDDEISRHQYFWHGTQ